MADEEVEEVVEETAAATDEAADVEEDEVILDGIEMPKEEKTAEPEKEEKEAPKEPSDLEKRMAELEKSYTNASSHIKDLQAALHKERQEKKALKDKGKDAEEYLTDEQVKAILEEHGNDWSTVLRVVNHQAAKAAAKTKGEVLNDVETKAAKDRLDNYLKTEWPEALQEGTEIRGHIEKIKGDLRLDDNPYSDFLAAGAFFLTNWKNAAKQIEEKAKAEALGDKVESKRKEVVKKTGLTKTAGDSKTVPPGLLPANLAEKAKQMGLNKRQQAIYAKLVKGGGSMSAQVGV